METINQKHKIHRFRPFPERNSKTLQHNFTKLATRIGLVPYWCLLLWRSFHFRYFFFSMTKGTSRVLGQYVYQLSRVLLKGSSFLTSQRHQILDFIRHQILNPINFRRLSIYCMLYTIVDYGLHTFGFCIYALYVITN